VVLNFLYGSVKVLAAFFWGGGVCVLLCADWCPASGDGQQLLDFGSGRTDLSLAACIGSLDADETTIFLA
jgi:hypothetical protein